MARMKDNGTLKHIRVDQVGSLVPDARWRDVVDRYKRAEANIDELCKALNDTNMACLPRSGLRTK